MDYDIWYDVIIYVINNEDLSGLHYEQFCFHQSCTTFNQKKCRDFNPCQKQWKKRDNQHVAKKGKHKISKRRNGAARCHGPLEKKHMFFQTVLGIPVSSNLAMSQNPGTLGTLKRTG